MAPIRYHYTGDEDQLPVTPPPPLNLEEDSDSWWAGVKHCFVAVPLVSAIAATALSASLAFGYTQQTEDIVEQPAPQIAVEEYYFAPPSRQVSWLAWLPPADQEIVPQPPSLTVDEDYWSILPILERQSTIQPFITDEQTVPQPAAFVPDEDYWFGPFFRSDRWQNYPFAVNDEIVPQPPVLTVDEDYWNVHTTPRPSIRILYLPDAEEIPAGSLQSFGIGDVIISTVDGLTPQRTVDGLTPVRTVEKL